MSVLNPEHEMQECKVQRLINVKGEHEVIQSVINVHAPPPPLR
jgi:hypothetical protein